jgi:septal ring factor EnvC (AmiA/AmiB activator)
MDYDFRIKLAEKELAHLQEMQQIARERQDTTDSAIVSIKTILERTEKNIEALSEGLVQLQVSQAKTEKMLQDLIAALLREHPNGKTQP